MRVAEAAGAMRLDLEITILQHGKPRVKPQNRLQSRFQSRFHTAINSGTAASLPSKYLETIRIT